MRREEGGGSGSLTCWVGTVGEDEGKGYAEPLVQIPEKRVTRDLCPGSCPFHRERLGPEEFGSQGHSGALRGPQESSAAWLHSVQS